MKFREFIDAMYPVIIFLVGMAIGMFIGVIIILLKI